jgi:serine protease
MMNERCEFPVTAPAAYAGSALAILGGLLGCAGPAPGAPEGEAYGAPWLEEARAAGEAVTAPAFAEGREGFIDRGRPIHVVRGAREAGSSAPSPVLLRYEDRALTVPALVGKNAIVRVEGLADEDLGASLSALGVRPVRPLMPSIGLWLVEDASGEDGLAVAQRLAPRLVAGGSGARGITQAIPDLYLRRKLHGDAFTPDDPRYSGQWFFDNLRMSEAWGITKGDPSITIVVIDSGCDLGHPDLAAKMDPGKDVVAGDDDPSFSPGLADNAHGTACAGIVGASTNNAEGIAGACPECRVRCVKLLDGETMIPLSADVDAFNFAIETGAAVVSNSWGFSEAIPVPKSLEDAINNVFDNGRGGLGALVLFAVGNDDREIENDELAAVRGVLGIGAINNLESETPFTNFGDAVDLVAPTGTLSTDISGADGYNDKDYLSNFGGTSSACPVAAGAAALVVSAAPGKTAAELYDVLIKTATPAPYAVPDANGHDAVFGYGIVDPTNALKDVLGIKDPPGAGGGAGPPPVGATGGDDPDAGCDCAAVGERPRSGPSSLSARALAMALALAAFARGRWSARARRAGRCPPQRSGA